MAGRCDTGYEKKIDRAVVRTVSPQYERRLASNTILNCIKTPEGSNTSPNTCLHEDVLIGGEEAGGIPLKETYPKGDGVLMGLLILKWWQMQRHPG